MLELIKKYSLLAFVIICCTSISTAQNQHHQPDSAKGLHVGLFVGTYFANNHTASLYDGYGYDINGQRNNFATSVLRNEIENIYGGRNGGIDQIAQLLNVNTQDWSFNETGMPINLRYRPTYIVGLNLRYLFDKKQAFTLNINGTRLTSTGAFVINSTGSVGTSTNPAVSNNNRQNQFAIIGGEQRLLIQFGYQRYFGNNQKINFFAETGFAIVMAKLEKNMAILNYNNNTLVIDLMNVYNQDRYFYLKAQYFTGVNIGAYAGLGINMKFNPKYTVQLVYQPSYDRVPLGDNPLFKFNHSLGLRIFFNLSHGQHPAPTEEL